MILEFFITHWQTIGMAILLALLVIILLIAAIDAQEGDEEE
jgi:hypothetical protein